MIIQTTQLIYCDYRNRSRGRMIHCCNGGNDEGNELTDFVFYRYDDGISPTTKSYMLCISRYVAN